MITPTFSSNQTNPEKKTIKRLKFTDEEDQEIRALVTRFGTDAWDQVAKAMNSQRTKRQVRERWQSYICPELEPRYTEMEDQLLEALYLQIGPQWAKIALMIGKKSGISTRNRYRSLQSMKTRGTKPDYDLMDAGVNMSDSPECELDELRLTMNTTGFDDTWPCECDELLGVEGM
jgi:hypothetical protein